MSHLSGWAGSVAAGSTEYLQKSVTGTPERPAAGGNWGCAAPTLLTHDGMTVALRGQPTWRTSETDVLRAQTPAHALLIAYRLWGTTLLERLYGNFALAIVDHATAGALLAIDRMGVERLTYALHDKALIFSTSAEFVAHFPARQARLRPQALLSYVYFHMIPAPETVFEGVHKLPPATALEFKGGALRQIRYWQPKFATSSAGTSFATLKQALHASLDTAVRATAPNGSTGAFLSGGLDSSTVAGFLARNSQQPARTFSMGFGFPEYDELQYARLANQRFGCAPQEYEVTAEDIVELLPKVAAAYDEPFGNASAIPTLCCARLARQHGVDHLLAGDGGDEIFAGNKRYAEQRVFERYQMIPAPLRSLLLEPILGNLPASLQVSVLRQGRNYIAQAKTPLPERFENWNFLHRLGFGEMLDPQFIAAVDADGPLKRMREVYESAPPADLVDRMLYYDWHFTLADNDLRKVGTMCELAGVRVSYPMLHQDVVDVSTQVPADMKMQGTHLRTFYKRAMQDFLPEQIINKSKHGFGLPFGLWLQRSTRLADQIDANLAGLRRRHIVRPEFIDRLRALHDQRDAHYYGVLIWTFSMLEQWFQEHRIAP